MQVGWKTWAGMAAAVGGITLAGAALVMGEPEPQTTAPAATLALAAPAPKTPDAPAAASRTAADERFIIKRILPIDGPIKYGEWHWDDQGVPDGPIVITVDLEARVLSVFKSGYEIGATAVLLGYGEKPTPLGMYPIKYKDADHHSSTYNNASMPFTMNLTSDGVAIHGTKVENGYASHGCVGVPTPFARKLFGITKVGDKVFITRGKSAGLGDSLTGS